MKVVPKPTKPEEPKGDQQSQPRGKNAKKAELLDRALKHADVPPITLGSDDDTDT
jgi:hypothetical protein